MLPEPEENAEKLKKTGLCDIVLEVDAINRLEVLKNAMKQLKENIVI